MRRRFTPSFQSSDEDSQRGLRGSFRRRLTKTHPRAAILVLLAASLLWAGAGSAWSKDDASLGVSTVRSIAKKNPTLSPEDATVQALKELGSKQAARGGAAEEGLNLVWKKNPDSLKDAALKVIAADKQVAGYVVRTAGHLNLAVNQDVMIAAAKANPEFVGFAVRAACDNDPAHYRELALAAAAAQPGHGLDIIGGVMASSASISRVICWHYPEIEKRKDLDVGAVLTEAEKWEADSQKVSPPSEEPAKKPRKR